MTIKNDLLIIKQDFNMDGYNLKELYKDDKIKLKTEFNMFVDNLQKKMEQADTSEAVLQLESRFCFANRLKKYEQFIEYQKNTLNDELSIYNKFTSIDEVINEYCEIKNKILEDKEALLCL